MNNIDKTRELLKNYRRFKSVLIDKKKLIDEIQQFGVPTKSTSVSVYSSNQSEFKEDMAEEYINTLLYQISSLERHIRSIDRALEAVKDDRYYKIIDYRYFKNLTYTQISDIFCLDRSNVCRNDKRLVKEMSRYIFLD